MAKHRSHSIEFKRQVAQEYLAGETLFRVRMIGSVNPKRLDAVNDPNLFYLTTAQVSKAAPPSQPLLQPLSFTSIVQSAAPIDPRSGRADGARDPWLVIAPGGHPRREFCQAPDGPNLASAGHREDDADTSPRRFATERADAR